MLIKIPHYLRVLLTMGATLTLGLLSFSGMFVLFPNLGFAIISFILSIYEAEIYKQNINGASNKLSLKRDYLKQYLATTFIQEKMSEIDREQWPQFFHDYEKQLHLLNQFHDKKLTKEIQLEKKQVKQELEAMEHCFIQQLFSPTNHTSSDEYETALQRWISQNGQEEAIKKLKNYQTVFNKSKWFSIFAGIFMGMGMTYLLVEAFSALPFLAVISLNLWPIFIVPLSLISGAAYALLTYNAITDMIIHDTLRNWYKKLTQYGWTPRGVFLSVSTLMLGILALALTLCTAGTWWTVAKNSKPLFQWFERLPNLIMGFLNPIITGFSALIFNLQNTCESLEFIDESTQPTPNTSKSKLNKNIFQSIKSYFTEHYLKLEKKENKWQIFNPFRLLLNLIVNPLRILLFGGHLISIGVTTDQMPGVSPKISAAMGIASEGIEDLHYLLDFHEAHSCHTQAKTTELVEARNGTPHGHTHNADLPTRFIKFILSYIIPLYFLTATWDYFASKANNPTTKRVLSFTDAWKKHRNEKEEDLHACHHNKSLALPSPQWKKHYSLSEPRPHKERCEFLYSYKSQCASQISKVSEKPIHLARTIVLG